MDILYLLLLWLAQFSDFENPIEGSELNGYEMRENNYNTDGSLFNRHILLDKFFNLNQVASSVYSVVKFQNKIYLQ
jgi:hypothetical protein